MYFRAWRATYFCRFDNLFVHGLTWDGEYAWGISYFGLHEIDLNNGNILESFELPRDFDGESGLSYDGSYFWTYILYDWDLDLVQFKLIPEQTTTTTTTSPNTTTSTSDDECVSEAIYGSDSGETELLRSIRDNVLSKTSEGQELTKLYYQWSPVIVRAMQTDEEFKQEVKDIVDGVLGVVE